MNLLKKYWWVLVLLLVVVAYFFFMPKKAAGAPAQPSNGGGEEDNGGVTPPDVLNKSLWMKHYNERFNALQSGDRKFTKNEMNNRERYGYNPTFHAHNNAVYYANSKTGESVDQHAWNPMNY